MPTPNSLRVAVIIPCYNHAPYLKEAVESVVNQDYDNKVIYFSDEGSTDDSFSVMTSLLDKDEADEDLVCNSINMGVVGTIQGVPAYITKNPDPKGPSAARNRLIKIAWESSDAFAMLDADDYYLPGKLSKSVAKMQEHYGIIGLVYTDAIIQNDKLGTKTREYRQPYSREALEQECIISNTPLVNKVVLDSVGLYDEEMRTAEDWDLWLRITKESVAVHIPEALHVYRVTGKNSSNVVPREVWEQNWRRISERINGKRN